MGGTTSALLPEYLDEGACAQICEDKFSQEVFDSLKQENGLVAREAFVRYIQMRNTSSLSSNSSHVRDGAMKDIFRAYSYPAKELCSTRYLQLLRDIRWMNAKFPSKDAVALFDAHKNENECVTYDIFLGPVLEEIAQKKEWEKEKALKRLSRHDSATMAAYVTRNISGRGNMDTVQELYEAPTTPVPVDRSSSGVPCLQETAAIKLQSMLRQKSSTKVLKELREVNYFAFSCQCVVVSLFLSRFLHYFCRSGKKYNTFGRYLYHD